MRFIRVSAFHTLYLKLRSWLIVLVLLIAGLRFLPAPLRSFASHSGPRSLSRAKDKPKSRSAKHKALKEQKAAKPSEPIQMRAEQLEVPMSVIESSSSSLLSHSAPHSAAAVPAQMSHIHSHVHVSQHSLHGPSDWYWSSSAEPVSQPASLRASSEHS